MELCRKKIRHDQQYLLNIKKYYYIIVVKTQKYLHWPQICVEYYKLLIL